MKNLRWKGRWLCRLAAALLTLPGCAADGPDPASSTPPNRFWTAFEQDIEKLPRRVLHESGETYLDRDNLNVLLLAGAGSIALNTTNADKRLGEDIYEQDGLDGFTDEAFNIIGCPATHFAATGLWYALAADSDDQLNRSRAWTLMTALSLNGLTTMALKVINHNHSPNGEPLAWPSGHTSSSFTVAAVLDEYYGPRIGIPAYLAAGFVGYRMMDSGDHWPSDVLFGAALGYVVGHSVAGRQKDLEIAGFKLTPTVIATPGRTATGLALTKRF